MRTNATLIAAARRDSDNVDYTDTTGLSDADFLEWMANAQERIQGKILQVNPKLFQKTVEIDGVASQERYDLPADIYLGTRVDMIEYSSTGLSSDYDPLDELQLIEYVAGMNGTPSGFIRQSGEFISIPAPASTGKFRVTYQKRLPKLGLSRGVLSAASTGGSPITATISPSTLDTDNITALETAGSLTVINTTTGAVKARDCVIDSISVIGVITFDATFALATGETIEAGDTVVAGGFHTTISQLPEEMERYLVAYMIWKGIKRDSSSDSAEAKEERDELETEIVDSYRMADNTLNYVPVLDDSNF